MVRLGNVILGIYDADGDFLDERQDVYECPTCGSLVREDSLEVHATWHNS